MGHPELLKITPFEVAPFFTNDEELHPLLVPIVKATYNIRGNNQLMLAEEQVPINYEGELWGEPGKSSLKYEGDGPAFFKPTTDIALIGHAYAQRSGVKEAMVSLHVGSIQKHVRIIGNRTWIKAIGSITPSEPEPFEQIPLIYERAYGGWDRSDPDPEQHAFEPRNPVGTGFLSRRRNFEEGISLPNLEDPKHRITNFRHRPPPAGFGFTSPHWQPRAALCGTYDKKWEEERKPLLPGDFDRRFFNAASAGLIADDYLRGDEPVLIENVTPEGSLQFSLPGVAPPTCCVMLQGGKIEEVETKLDTVIINTDERLLLLIWRANIPLGRGPEDVLSMKTTSEGTSTQKQESELTG